MNFSKRRKQWKAKKKYVIAYFTAKLRIILQNKIKNKKLKEIMTRKNNGV